LETLAGKTNRKSLAVVNFNPTTSHFLHLTSMSSLGADSGTCTPISELYNDSLCDYVWAGKKKPFTPISVDLRVRLRASYGVNYEVIAGWKKRHVLIFADPSGLFCINIESDTNISKDQQTVWARNIEQEYPVGQEFIIELYNDHYNALIQERLAPEECSKFGIVNPFILTLPRPTFSTDAHGATTLDDHTAWPHIMNTALLQEVSLPGQAPGVYCVPDIQAFENARENTSFTMIVNILHVERRELLASPSKESAPRQTKPLFTIKFNDIYLPGTAPFKSLNIFGNSSPDLVAAVTQLATSGMTPTTALFTSVIKRTGYLNATPATRVTALPDQPARNLFAPSALSDFTFTRLDNVARDNQQVRQSGGMASTLATARFSPAALATAKRSPSKYGSPASKRKLTFQQNANS
jgi:hypothetical protein